MDENGWEWMRMNEDEWEWIRMDENGLEWMRIYLRSRWWAPSGILMDTIEP